MNRLHRESGDERPEYLFNNTKGSIRLLLLPVLHGGSRLKTGGAHFLFVVVGSFTQILLSVVLMRWLRLMPALSLIGGSLLIFSVC